MRRKATIGGPGSNEETACPTERGASGYRRFGGRAETAATPRAGRVTAAAGVATVVALGSATFAPFADAQPVLPALPPGPVGPLAGPGTLLVEEEQGEADDVVSLLDLRRDDRDERELLRRLMALAQVIVTAIVDGQLPQQGDAAIGGGAPDEELVEALVQLRALAEALASGAGDGEDDGSTPPAVAQGEPATPLLDTAEAAPAEEQTAEEQTAEDQTAEEQTVHEPAAGEPAAEAAPAEAAPVEQAAYEQTADEPAETADPTPPPPAPAEAGQNDGREALAAAEARQAAAREAAERAGREVARQAGAGFGGCDEVPESDSVGQDSGGSGPSTSAPPPAAPASAQPAGPAPAPVAPSAPPVQPVSLPAAEAPPAPASSSAEAEFLVLLNSERAKVGLPALVLDGGLQAAAAAQAANIAAAGSLYHQDLVPLLGPWRTVGENVGYGPSVASINTALVNSPGHYANMVNPDFTHAGIAVVVTADGRVWVSQVFGG